MRILGFSEKWPKLEQKESSTFRFPRRDRDWQAGEVVQVVFRPRTKGREILGVATIVSKEPRWVILPEQIALILPRVRMNPEWDSVFIVSEQEAVEDGFEGREAMITWMSKQHKGRLLNEPMNKLALRWVGAPE